MKLNKIDDILDGLTPENYPEYIDFFNTIDKLLPILSKDPDYIDWRNDARSYQNGWIGAAEYSLALRYSIVNCYKQNIDISKELKAMFNLFENIGTIILQRKSLDLVESFIYTGLIETLWGATEKNNGDNENYIPGLKEYLTQFMGPNVLEYFSKAY